MPYQSVAKKVREYLVQVVPQESKDFKLINEIATAIVRGVVEEQPGTYINTTTGEYCSYVEMIAGDTIIKGQSIVLPQSGGPKIVIPCPITGDTQDMPGGISLDSVTIGQVVRIAVKGIALALPDTGITAAKGNVAYSSSTTAGRLAQAAGIGTAQHWRESGHWAETGSGNGALALLLIHHN